MQEMWGRRFLEVARTNSIAGKEMGEGRGGRGEGCEHAEGKNPSTQAVRLSQTLRLPFHKSVVHERLAGSQVLCYIA
jgi:hypothetical protein